ncbi:hypothetical protein ACEQ8H_003113 [Pleosporales sp. CAS-2024a]
MPMPSHSRAFDTAYLPTKGIFGYQEPLEGIHLTDAYAMSPDDSLSTLFDTESFFDQAYTMFDKKSSNPSANMLTFDRGLLPTGNTSASAQYGGQGYLQATSSQTATCAPWSYLDTPTIDPAGSTSFSPASESLSRTPSLCSDNQRQPQSPTMSPRPIKREPQSDLASPHGQQIAPQRPLKKRGRPRLDRLDSFCQSSGPSSAKMHRSRRLPHNQVERKYREGLNSELERLRNAVPSLSPSQEDAAIDQPKPSKGMILASAIDYIKTIERERDALLVENEQLRQSQISSHSWAGGSSSLDDFLADIK